MLETMENLFKCDEMFCDTFLLETLLCSLNSSYIYFYLITNISNILSLELNGLKKCCILCLSLMLIRTIVCLSIRKRRFVKRFDHLPYLRLQQHILTAKSLYLSCVLLFKLSFHSPYTVL